MKLRSIDLAMYLGRAVQRIQRRPQCRDPILPMVGHCVEREARRM
jgi:hypothetical protein